MIVKFHNRGRGGGSGPVDYLLGKDRQREQARVLRGDPEDIRQLIDSVQFKQRYKSGVLSFEESDIPEAQKQRLMNSFQQMLLPGMAADQYGILWVEHRDKGRLELNFLIPTVELKTGKRLQPYFDRIDRQRVNDWKCLVNHHYGFSDPDDPIRRRSLTTPANLPQAVADAQQAITDGVLALVDQGVITDRTTLVQALTEGGFTVARQTKSSISIENPGGGRNIRLSGAVFARDFTAGPAVAAEIAAASERYRAEAETRIREIRQRCQEAVAVRAKKNRDRYRRSLQKVAPEPLERPQEQFSGRSAGFGVPAVRRSSDVVPDERRVELAGVSGRGSAPGRSDSDLQSEMIDDGIGNAVAGRIRAAAGVARAVAAGLWAGAQRIAAAIARTEREQTARTEPTARRSVTLRHLSPQLDGEDRSAGRTP